MPNVVYCRSDCRYSVNGICKKPVVEIHVFVSKLTGRKRPICSNYKEKAAHESD